jgi:uncharacterized membrane protein
VAAAARASAAAGGRRLMDAVGWAAVLPLMLAAFGTVLKETGSVI